MVRRKAQYLVHHHGIGHRRIDRAEPVLTVQPFLDEGHGLVDRALPQLLRHPRFNGAQQDVDAGKEGEQRAALVRRARGAADQLGILQEQFADIDLAKILRTRLFRSQHHQRHDGGAGPIRHLVEVKRKPERQKHDLDRQHRNALPGQHTEHRQHEAREHVAMDRAAARTDRLARFRHIGFVGIDAHHLQREVCFHAGAHVERAVLHQRPAAMRALGAANVVADLALQLVIDGLGEIVPQQRVFGGDRDVRLELEHPMAVWLAESEQALLRRRDAAFQRRVRNGGLRMIGLHLVRHDVYSS